MSNLVISILNWPVGRGAMFSLHPVCRRDKKASANTCLATPMRQNPGNGTPWEHAMTCHGQFDWNSNITLGIEPDYHHRKIREALEIRSQKSGPNYAGGLNRYQGNLLKTDTWNALFHNWEKTSR